MTKETTNHQPILPKKIFVHEIPEVLNAKISQPSERLWEYTMACISAHNLCLSFSGPLLLDDVHVQIQEGERICLLGRNGEGKSSLMRILAGELAPDTGEIRFAKGLQVASMPQEVPEDLTGTVFEVVTAGAGDAGKTLLAACGLYTSGDLPLSFDDPHVLRAKRRIEAVLHHLGLDAKARFSNLSGGMKRRVLLARAVSGDPDVLFLDEPTNHLDVQSVCWLETFLKGLRATVFFVTHDRMFLRHVARRILELDRGQLVDWACDYETFLRRKEEVLAAEENQWHKFDRKLREEEIWIRQGIKARRTRNEGRVRTLLAMRAERHQRRERVGQVRLQAQQVGTSGKLVVDIENLSFSYGEKNVVRDFSLVVTRGDRIGVIGPNGAGKTTFLGLLLGELQPQQGRVRLGTNLEIAYSDQMRDFLDSEKSARELIAEGADYVDIDGNRRHVLGYLKDFLFTPARAQIPVGLLSGGERNRLLLARLFTRPCNLLILDEPSNDLDQETLELLEELVSTFSGTVIVVSHDREFLNNTVTSCLVFEGEGRVVEYAGGYDDWLSQRPDPTPVISSVEKNKAPRVKSARPAKMTYKETKELEALPEQIETLEGQLASVRLELENPEFYQNTHTLVAEKAASMQEIEERLDALLARWTELEELRALYNKE